MSALWPHIRAIYGTAALFVTLLFVQIAAYRSGIELGDLTYFVSVIILTLLAVFYGAKMEGLAFASTVSMAISFGLVGMFTNANWLIRRMLHDIPVTLAESPDRSGLVMYVVMPLVLTAIIGPVVVKAMRNEGIRPGRFI